MGFLGLCNDIAIDLGTSSTLIYAKGKGIVLREPSVVIVRNDSTKKIISAGNDAKQMIGRMSKNTLSIKPLRDGAIADIDIAPKMLQYFIKKALGRSLVLKSRIIICHPAEMTQVERIAIEETAYRSGAGRVFLISMPLAAAMGAGLPIDNQTGNIIADIGGGTTDIAIVSSGDIIVSKSLRIAGDEMDKAIVSYIKKKYRLIIGEVKAEQIKIEMGYALLEEAEKTMEIGGRDLVSEFPKLLTITSTEINRALKESLDSIINAIKSVLVAIPPELSADIMKNGIILTGGGALLNGFDKLLRTETSLPVNIADNPLDCAVLGAGLALDNIKRLRLTNSLLQS